MPNYLAEQFWRSLVGGRLFFDDELRKKYASEIKQNPMFEVNGTKPLKELMYSMTLAQARQNYGEWLDIWNMAQQSDCEVEMLCLNENIVRQLAENRVNLEDEYGRLKYARKAIQDILDGAPFAKTYMEFRNGFRHVFSALMQNSEKEDNFLKEAKLIDRCLELINYRELEEILTYDPDSEQAIDRAQATWLVLGQNEQWLKQNNAPKIFFQCLEKIIDAVRSQFFTSQNLVNFVFAATGARTMVGNRVFLKFYSQRESEKGT